jgi:hypothetical protein
MNLKKTLSNRRTRLAIAVIAASSVLFSGVLVAGTAMAAGGPKPTVKALGADVVHLSWTAVSGASSYQVRYSTSSKMSSAKTVTKVDDNGDGTATAITKNFTNISGLSAKKTYYFQVIGVDATGKTLSSWGNTSSGAKTFYSYGTPTALAAANIASTWIELAWNPVSGAPGYSIRYYNQTDGARYVWNQVENFTLHGKNDSDNLRKNTKYWLKVAVQQPPIGTPGTSGYTPLVTMSPFSKEITLTTSNYAIAAPSDVQVSKQTPNSFAVSWEAPSGVNSTMKYRVQYSKNANMSGAKNLDVASGSTSATLTGLANNTTYYVRVLVIDAATGAQKSDRSAYQIGKTRVPKGTIKGTVQGPSGSDVVAMVYGTGGEMVAQSDVSSSGAYSVSVRPGAYRVMLSYIGKGGYTSMWASSAKGGGVPVFSQGTSLSVAGAGSTVTAPTVTLAKGASLPGVVKYSGSGLNGVYVTSLTAQTTAREVEDVAQTPTSSGTDGSYAVQGLSDGQHWVRFAKSGYKTVSIWLNVQGAKVTQYRLSTETSPHAYSGSGLTVNMSK